MIIVWIRARTWALMCAFWWDWLSHSIGPSHVAEQEQLPDLLPLTVSLRQTAGCIVSDRLTVFVDLVISGRDIQYKFVVTVSVCLSVCPSVCLVSTGLPVCLSIGLSVCLAMYVGGMALCLIDRVDITLLDCLRYLWVSASVHSALFQTALRVIWLPISESCLGKYCLSVHVLKAVESKFAMPSTHRLVFIQPAAYPSTPYIHLWSIHPSIYPWLGYVWYVCEANWVFLFLLYIFGLSSFWASSLVHSKVGNFEPWVKRCVSARLYGRLASFHLLHPSVCPSDRPRVHPSIHL